MSVSVSIQNQYLDWHVGLYENAHTHYQSKTILYT